MTARDRLLTVLLGIAGLIAAAAITLAANAISGREIGLSAQPVSLAEAPLRPKPAPGARTPRQDGHARSEAAGHHGSGEDSAGVSSSPGPSGSSGSRGEDHGGTRGSGSPSGTSGSGSG